MKTWQHWQIGKMKMKIKFHKCSIIDIF